MAVSIDQQFIEYIVKSVVGRPDDVKIERRIDEKGVLLELSVNPEDLGRVIGKRGATAQSMRTLLRALGTKNDARYNLKIIDTGPPPENREQRAENKEETTAKSVSSDDSVADDQATPASAAADDSVPTDVPADEPAADDITAPTQGSEPRTSDASRRSAADNIDMSDDEELPETPSDHSDVVSRTRKELADLDDLDV